MWGCLGAVVRSGVGHGFGLVLGLGSGCVWVGLGFFGCFGFDCMGGRVSEEVWLSGVWSRFWLWVSGLAGG